MISSLPIPHRLLCGALSVLLLLGGCTRDPEELLPFDGEGRPATVTLSWSAPDMDVLSRAETSPSKVEGVWVGIFNAYTGQMTGSDFFDVSSDNEETSDPNLIGKIETKSGESRIVAVANYTYYYGITGNETLQEKANEAAGLGAADESLLRWKMQDLLAAVSTWDEFRSIVVLPNDARDLSDGGAPFLMSGVFVPKTDSHPSGADWIASNKNTYSLSPNDNDLRDNGSIHLRRVLSHVKFSVTGNTEKQVSVKVNSWRVHYKPMLCYLYERETNAADEEQYIFGRFTPDFKPLESSTANVYEHNYIDALRSTSITTYSTRADTGADAETTYNFSFYQFENKHTGHTWTETANGETTTYGTAYADREREYKEPVAGASDTPSAATRVHDGTVKETNTGLYKMLCADDTPPVTMADKGGPNANVNNFATFVEINATVSYPVTDGEGNTYTRTGDVTYVVHLGYCEGGNDEAAKSLDFNCRRNTEYTYNVTVNGLESIVVEVQDGTENQPGAEGTVVDTSETKIDLDAHYCVFNVGFTESELNALSYSLMAYFNGNEIAIVDDEDSAAGRADTYTYANLQNLKTTDKNRYYYLSQFYSWICFKATRDKSSLRLFKDGESKNAAEDGSHFFIPENDPDLLYLEDLKNYKANYIDTKKPFFQPVTNEKGEEIYWFTCFAREYVYYYDTDGSQMWSTEDANGTALAAGQYRETGWHNYVDERPRVCNLSISGRRSSPDGESRHAYAKYRIEQQSIQTFYISDQSGVGDGTAFGAEHTNESYGLNLRWADEKPHVDGTAQFWNRDNGRWNMWYNRLEGGKRWNSVLAAYGEKEITIIQNGIETKKTVAFQKAGNVPAIDPWPEESGKSRTWNLSETDYFWRPATLYPVPLLQPANNEDIMGNDDVGLTRGYYDPNQTAEYYKALYACMSRNRDINGNGVIDANELRWYLPTAGKYLRIQIGAKALSDPLVPVGRFNPKEYIRSDDHTYFHYITSDAFLVWAEEGGSLGTRGINPNESWLTGWNIRCIRNLGSVPQRLMEEDPIQPAYQHDRNNRIVSQTYYDPSVLRLFKVEGRGIDPHPINDDYNQPYKAFQYAKDDCKDLNANQGLSMSGYYLSGWTEERWTKSLRENGFCGQYSEEEGGTDKGTWRVPTQKELTILRRLHQYGDATVQIFAEPTRQLTKWLTCTYDMLPKDVTGAISYRYCGIQYNNRINPNWDYWTNTPADDGNEYNFSDSNQGTWRRIRCVRDVD